MTLHFSMHKPRTFFIVDDDIDDQELFIEAVSEVDRSISCIPVSNCEEALAVLKSTKTDLPDMIFLDLNMPRLNGKQCLRNSKGRVISKTFPLLFTPHHQKKETSRKPPGWEPHIFSLSPTGSRISAKPSFLFFLKTGRENTVSFNHQTNIRSGSCNNPWSVCINAAPVAPSTTR